MEDVEVFFNGTLFAHQLKIHKDKFLSGIDGEEEMSVKLLAEKYLKELLEMNLIRVREHKENESEKFILVETTKLGDAAYQGGVDLSIANMVYKDLQRGLHSLVLVNYLHLLYLVTPYESAANVTPNWMTYFEEYGKLNEYEQKAAVLIGVTEQYLAAKATGQHIRRNRKVSFFIRTTSQ